MSRTETGNKSYLERLFIARRIIIYPVWDYTFAIRAPSTCTSTSLGSNIRSEKTHLLLFISSSSSQIKIEAGVWAVVRLASDKPLIIHPRFLSGQEKKNETRTVYIYEGCFKSWNLNSCVNAILNTTVHTYTLKKTTLKSLI